MTHPSREDLVCYLYDELDATARPAVADHLKDCAECRQTLESLQAVRRGLAEWQIADAPRIAAVRKARLALPTVVRWAASAAAMVALGFGLARWSTPNPEAARAAIAAEVRQELRQELQQFASSQDARLREYREAMTTVLGQMEAQRVADYADLRRDMETVAITAETGLRSTSKGLYQLAAIANRSKPAQNP